MEKVELVFVPAPGIGHIVSTIEFAKHLIQRDNRFSITLLVMKAPFFPSVDPYIKSLSTSLAGVRFIDLPQPTAQSDEKSPLSFMSVFIESHKPHVKDAITHLRSSTSFRLAGLVVDMFCVTMMDVANELGISTYLYFTSAATMLGLMLHLPILDKQITTDIKDATTELMIPSFRNPVSPLLMPSVVLKRDATYETFVNLGRRFKEVKGRIINTFAELEPHGLNSITDGENPPVYPVGPLLDLNAQSHHGSNQDRHDEIMKWLDDQPPSSVVLLCFGSMGGFGAAQVKEIALGLERSSYRFVWSLRQPPKKDYNSRTATEYTDFKEILPEGFMERTEGRGLVCGWVPQVAILAHPATGGFVSHCGWNSSLESLWYGVPILTWPLYAEQQMNAFMMVKELGLAVEMRLDYRTDSGDLVKAEEVERGVRGLMESESEVTDGGDLVKAEEVERGVRRLMESESEVRRKVKEMGEMSRSALKEGGSSFNALGRLIEELMVG